MRLRRPALAAAVAAVTLALLAAPSAATRGPLSPFPPPAGGLVTDARALPPLYALELRGLSNEERLLAATLQGVINRRAPAMYRSENVLDARSGYGMWLAELDARHGVRVNTTFVRDLPGLLALAAPRLRGYVLADAGSVNVAVTACAALGDAVVVMGPTLVLAARAGLTGVLDVRGRDEGWALGALGGASAAANLSRSVIVLQDPSK